MRKDTSPSSTYPSMQPTGRFSAYCFRDKTQEPFHHIGCCQRSSPVIVYDIQAFAFIGKILFAILTQQHGHVYFPFAVSGAFRRISKRLVLKLKPVKQAPCPSVFRQDGRNDKEKIDPA